ncbi:MAG: hypothetical protein G01um101466_830, partial [Parcubacteria group bacterium Gr01-1014_66]
MYAQELSLQEESVMMRVSFVPIAQRIERRPPEPEIRVRFLVGAPKLTLSEMTAPRGEYAALRRAKSAFVFAVKSQSSPQLI